MNTTQPRREAGATHIESAFWERYPDFGLIVCDTWLAKAPDRALPPIDRDIWPHVKDQGGAYQTKGKLRRDERNHHCDREAREDNE